jgi:hypothetical protein
VPNLQPPIEIKTVLTVGQGPAGPAGPEGSLDPTALSMISSISTNLSDINSLVAAISSALSITPQPFQYTQATPQPIWFVTHNLNKHPSVTVTDLNGVALFSDYEYINANQVYVYHATPQTGFVFCQ